MNLPNQLTVARLVLTGVFVLFFYLPWAYAHSLALIVFGIASFTDYLDGNIARARGLVTNFGKLFDPLADKILIAAAFILLSEKGWIPAWVTILILAREFFVTGIRQIAAAQGAILAAEKMGKHKMVWQILTVLYFLLTAAAQEPFVFSPLRGLLSPSSFHEGLGQGIIAFTILLTWVSGFSYFWKNRGLFSDA